MARLVQRTNLVILAAILIEACGCTTLLDLDKPFRDEPGGTGASSSGGMGGGGAGGGSPLPSGSPLWAIHLETTKDKVKIGAIAVDKDGNTWVVGSYSEALYVQPANKKIEGGGANSRSIFWLKLDPDGKVLADGTSFMPVSGLNYQSFAADIAITPDNNPVIVGSFSGTLNVLSLDPIQTNPTGDAIDKSDIFVLRLDTDGVAKSIVQYGLFDQNDNAQNVVLSHDGSTVIAGTIDGSAFPNGTAIPNKGGVDGFVMRILPGSTSVGWAHTFASEHPSDTIDEMVADSATQQIGIVGHCGLTLQTNAAAVFGDNAAAQPLNIFAAILDQDSGAIVGQDQPFLAISSVSQIAENEVYAALFHPPGAVQEFITGGRFGDTLGLGLGTKTSVSELDAYIATFPLGMAFKGTIEQFGEAGENSVRSMVNGTGNGIVIGGQMGASTLSLPGASSLSSPTAGPYLARIPRPGGSPDTWALAIQMDASDDDRVTAVAFDATSGAVIAAGQFDGTIDFGLGTTFTSGAPPLLDAFLVKVVY